MVAVILIELIVIPQTYGSLYSKPAGRWTRHMPVVPDRNTPGHNGTSILRKPLARSCPNIPVSLYGNERGTRPGPRAVDAAYPDRHWQRIALM
jgi:hypothetical protein